MVPAARSYEGQDTRSQAFENWLFGYDFRNREF